MLGEKLLVLAFDGNWEAMSGDIAFESKKFKERFQLILDTLMFIIDKFAGATSP